MNSRDSPGTPPFTSNEPDGIATFGLPKALNPIYNWAARQGLDSILVATLDATKTDRHPDYIGTFVRFLRQQETADFLATWASELPCAGELHRLSEACAVSPFMAATYPGMPSLKLVAHQLTGGLLTKLAAIALVARPIPAIAEKDRHWIAALRTWVFLQIIDSVFRGGRPNSYLLDVTNKLRLAIDRDEQWLALFVRLRGPSTSLHGMTRDLAAACRHLLDDRTNRVESSVHRLLLSSLRNVCNGKAPERQDDDDAESQGLFLKFLAQESQQRTASFLPIDDQNSLPQEGGSPPTQDGDVQGLTWNFDPPGSEESVLSLISIEKDRTPPEQDHQARGILLATAEDHQFLPYSWNRPSPTELPSLEKWIACALASDDFNLQVLATWVELAIQSANSLGTVLSLSLSKISKADWSCDIHQGCLHRLPPRRYNGWQITPEAATWVEPLAETSKIPLPPAAVSTLRRLFDDAPASTQLGRLWPTSIGEAPATMFNRICRETSGIKRLRSGMLSQVLEQRVFAYTGDPVLSELLASHPRTGLGGACAYASYQHAQVRSLLVQTTPDSGEPPNDPTDPQSNAAGSQLSPLDTALRQACGDALAKVNQLATQPEAWEMHHNALTAYVVVALLAATGSRPVTSPFESPAHFDWSMLTLYIEDKVSSRLHQGRLVPIPDWVASLIKDCYLPHLARLAILVSQIDATLSAEITNLSRGVHSDRLPLFFLLGTAPQLRWFEVSESSLSALEIFPWPLPWNLMRHRLPTTLKRAGHDHESINGITGHGDQGTAPYGTYSMRIWQEDARQLRQPLTDALASLQLQLPTAPQWPATPITPDGDSNHPSCLEIDRRFGTTARRTRRQTSHQQATQQAQDEISEFVGVRPIDSLTPGDWETLSQQMLLHGDGRPRTLGSIRYEALQHWIARNWEERGIRPRIKRRYLPSLEEPSSFTTHAIGCQKRIDIALEVARQITNSVEPSRTSRRESLALGIMLLILESRITDPSVLKDLLQAKDFRLVSFQKRYYLEHSPGLDKVAGAPVRRYEISATAAVLLARAKTAVNKLDLRQWPVTHKKNKNEKTKLGLLNIWEPISQNKGRFESLQACVLDVSAHMRQVNVLEYPGVIAAYLNGDIVSAGLGHADWMRVTLGKAAYPIPLGMPDSATECKDSKEDTDKDESEDEDEEKAPSFEMDATYVAWPDAFMTFDNEKVAGPPHISQLQKNSFEFFKKIRDALNESSNNKSPSRRDLDSKLRVLISENKELVSRSCLLLGEWQRSLLWRKTRKGLIRIRSLARYLNALSVCFQAMAYDHDLLKCDEDDVTEFYRRVMETRQLVHPGLSPETDPSSPTDTSVTQEDDKEEAAKRYRTQGLALQLLRDFHRLVSREFGVEDPDWSEISITDELLSISPGIMTEAEYWCALRILAPTPHQASREQLARAFILLTTYRFGLRGDEATGLFRSDWVDDQPDSIVVLVRGNRFRRLKTPAAQRQVPLLFELTNHEKEILSSWFASWDGITTLDGEGPLFADQKSPALLMNVKLLRRQVSEVIKLVTCNPDLSLHHARHAFANRVGLLLMSGAGNLWPHTATPEQSSEQRQSHVRRLLLNTDQVTRRTLWALARLLGHAHPQTTVRSYLHLLPDLAMNYVNLPAPEKRPVSQDLSGVCITLDDLAFREDYLQPIPRDFETAPPRVLTPDRALRFLHLCQRGVDIARAELVTGLPTEDANRLIKGLRQIDAILSRRPHINPPAAGPFNLLGHIPQGRWAELITRSHGVTWMAEPQETPDINIDELPMIIGSSRQIVLWKPSHFTFFKMVVDRWKLGESSYLIHSTARDRSNLLKMATEANLSLAEAPETKPPSGHSSLAKAGKRLIGKSQADKSFQQIDSIEVGNPAMLVRYRCGVLTQTHSESALRSSHELVLLMLVSLALQG